MAFSRNIFQAYTGMFVFEKKCFHILINREKHKMHMQQLLPSCREKENGCIALGVSVVDQKHEM